MVKARRKSLRRKRAVLGRGSILSSLGKVGSTVLNKTIDLLPVELHLPGYQYCGPGTNLKKRLARGDRGINGLDEACKLHDIAYAKYPDSENRRRADTALAERAWQRFKASDASLGEKAAAWSVTTAMKAKSKLGGGRKKTRRVVKRRVPTRGQGRYLRPCKEGSGKRRRRRTVKKKMFIPIKPLTNYELIKYAKLLKIPFFRGVHMRDTIPPRAKKRIFNSEFGLYDW